MTLATYGKRRLLFVIFAFLVVGTFPSCSQDKSKAEHTVDAYLRGFGVRDVKHHTYLAVPEVKDKAYLSVTATWNFADSKGEPVQEPLGYILRKEGEEWKIDKSVRYTTDTDAARKLLMGSK